MHIFLARHGQTNYNDLGLCNANPGVDVHLTEVGIRQSQELAEALKQAHFERIYASELKRTQQTAQYINRHHQVTVQIDKRLNDNRTGYEGRPAAEYYAAFEASPDKWTARLNDGESWEDVKVRVQAFMDELKARSYESVLIVTSMVIMQVVRGLVKGLANQQTWDLPVHQGTYLEFDI